MNYTLNKGPFHPVKNPKEAFLRVMCPDEVMREVERGDRVK